MKVSKFLATNKPVYNLRPPIRCADGVCLSVLVSPIHYSSGLGDEVLTAEVKVYGQPVPEWEKDHAILPYSTDRDYHSYGYVPLTEIDKFINQHGGIKE